MPRLRRARYERPLRQAQQIVRPHQPQHALVVHHHAITTQLCRNAPIAVVPVCQRHTLHGIAHTHLLLQRRGILQIPVVAGAADARDPALMFNV
jgi:hypothetical protein